MSVLWRYKEADRPAFAEVPGPGQESVWDYPRPPRLVPDARKIVVRAGEIEIARTRRTLRMLETASSPTFYLPFADARPELLVEALGIGSTYCEWKGSARYWSIVSGESRMAGAAWSYPSPRPPYQLLADYFSVYLGRVACFVDGERVQAQEGGFYGGWVSAEIVGPWKGGTGTSGW
jgi:uncharacterized protein (DUF427 family)